MIQLVTQPLPGFAPAVRAAGFPLGTTSDFALAFADLASAPGPIVTPPAPPGAGMTVAPTVAEPGQAIAADGKDLPVEVADTGGMSPTPVAPVAVPVTVATADMVVVATAVVQPDAVPIEMQAVPTDRTTPIAVPTATKPDQAIPPRFVAKGGATSVVAERPADEDADRSDRPATIDPQVTVVEPDARAGLSDLPVVQIPVEATPTAAPVTPAAQPAPADAETPAGTPVATTVKPRRAAVAPHPIVVPTPVIDAGAPVPIADVVETSSRKTGRTPVPTDPAIVLATSVQGPLGEAIVPAVMAAPAAPRAGTGSSAVVSAAVPNATASAAPPPDPARPATMVPAAAPATQPGPDTDAPVAPRMAGTAPPPAAAQPAVPTADVAVPATPSPAAVAAPRGSVVEPPAAAPVFDRPPVTSAPGPVVAATVPTMPRARTTTSIAAPVVGEARIDVSVETARATVPTPQPVLSDPVGAPIPGDAIQTDVPVTPAARPATPAPAATPAAVVAPAVTPVAATPPIATSEPVVAITPPVARTIAQASAPVAPKAVAHDAAPPPRETAITPVAVTVVALPTTLPQTQPQPAAQAFAAAMFAAAAPVDRRDEGGGDDLSFALTVQAAPTAFQNPALAVAPTAQGQQPTLDLTKGDWMASMIDRIETLRDDSGAVRETRMKLAPEALGNIEISVRRDENGAMQVRIAADTPQARAMLADAAPKLAEMAEARGVKLGGSSVDSHGGFADQGRRDAPPPTPVQRRPASAAATRTTDTTTDSRLA